MTSVNVLWGPDLGQALPHPAPRFKASPNFRLHSGHDGRAFIVETEAPYRQAWLEPFEAALFGILCSNEGCTTEEAMAALSRLYQCPIMPSWRDSFSQLMAFSAFKNVAEDVSRYGAEMAADYLNHRAFPAYLVSRVAEQVGLRPEHSVLDVAGGIGDLATQLAQTGSIVSLLELSRGFVNYAQALAKRRGVNLTCYHDSANLLSLHPHQYDVVTLAQAIHWLDPLRLAEGVENVVCDSGHFVVIQARFDVPHDHPLSDIFGEQSRLGHAPKASFQEQMKALSSTYDSLFYVLNPARSLKLRAARFFRQSRMIDLDYAKAFITSEHLSAAGLEAKVFWQDLDARCAQLPTSSYAAGLYWAVLDFGREPRSMEIDWDRFCTESF